VGEQAPADELGGGLARAGGPSPASAAGHLHPDSVSGYVK